MADRDQTPDLSDKEKRDNELATLRQSIDPFALRMERWNRRVERLLTASEPQELAEIQRLSADMKVSMRTELDR